MEKNFKFHIAEGRPLAEGKTLETIYSSRRIGNNTKTLVKTWKVNLPVQLVVDYLVFLYSDYHGKLK